MASYRPSPLLSVACLLTACIALNGCNSKEARARDAYAEYQAASAAGNMVGARLALMKLVSIDESVSEYWVELAKIQAANGSIGEAYHSLTRAYELDRSNVGLLRTLTEFALRGGDPVKAQEYARQLEVVAPGDPWVKLTSGYGALRESRFDEALKAADEVLQLSPFDPNAKVLKARALLGRQQEDEAVKLLAEQIRTQPNDVMSLQLLANIYHLRADWPRLSAIASQLVTLEPGNSSRSLLAIEAAFKAGQTEQARQVSLKLMGSGAQAQTVSQVLDLWIENWTSPQRVADAVRLGRAASTVNARLPYADFLNRVGSPASALALMAGAATSPVNGDNANANAISAEALGNIGKSGPAKKRFDDVLAYDPGNAIALRGRSNLLLRMSKASEAIPDAEKLVTVAPTAARDRLLLARVYAAAGDAPQAQRTLWDAFRDIPGDEQIYRVLLLQTRSDPIRQAQLQEEFKRQTATKIGQGLL